MKRLVLIAWVVLFAGSVAASRAEVRSIRPDLTNPEIDRWLDDHLVSFDASAPRQERLIVFLGGSGYRPNRYSLLSEEMGRAGFHAINLSYANDRPIEWQICRRSEDPDCVKKVRLEQFDGTDRTPMIDVSRANSIEMRIARLLTYLDRQFPGEGWGKYLTGDHLPAWESIVISGHSQGGGTTCIIGMHRKVARVVMFAWVDAPGGRLAPWIKPEGKTPIERYYAWRHRGDRFNATYKAWLALGLDKFGPLVDVDQVPPPYNNSHMLTSSMPFSKARTNADKRFVGHFLIISDDQTPVDGSGVPLFRPVWRYLWGTKHQ